MKVVRGILIFTISAFFFVGTATAELSKEREESISTLFEILFVIYDYDASRVPDEPNEILALETSSDSRDLLAWEIFKLIRYELDPSSMPPNETETVIVSQKDSGVESELNLDTNQLSSFDFPVMTMSLESEPVIDLSGPLDSCILEPQTYRIVQLPLEIAGHVVVPAGTRFIAPYDPNSNVIEVLSGGLLDIGKAALSSAEEYPDVLPAVEILPEDPNILFSHNYVGIYVHRGANPKTRIENVEISSCRTGIVIDESLYYPLRNVITFGCYDGIHLFAPTGLIDCEFWYNGSVWDWMSDYIMEHLSEYMNGTIFESIASYAGVGIYVCLDGQAYPYPEVSIERTIMYEGDVGLYIAGEYVDPNIPDPNVMAPYIPQVSVVNSCLTKSYFYGVYQSEGEAAADVQYSAFAANDYYHTNLDLPYTGCFVLSEVPLYNLQENWKRLYVDPWSELIDAGYGTITDGTGTCHNWPDIGRVDIGCHFPLGISGGFGIPSSPADFNWDGIVNGADLDLMNACMGATDDPNLLRMDFNYDSWVNMPDYGIVAYDFGYTADPNLPGHHDPNSQRSDFNGDLVVDMEDLAILAEEWLTPVFDEYRVCSLCNLHTGVDPNDPNAPSGTHIVDARDMAVFMEDWGHISIVESAISFKDNYGNMVDSNSLSEDITLCLEEYPSSSWIFLHVDGSPAAQTYADSSMPISFEIPTQEYSNGSHTLTIGGYTPAGGCWIQKVPVIFQNWFYLADIPRMYKAGESYSIRGFFDGGILSISIDPNLYVESTDGYIEFQSLITGIDPIVTISREEGGSLFLMEGDLGFETNLATSDSSAQSRNITLSEEVDMSEVDPNSFRALIVAPYKEANEDFEITLNAIRDALNLKGISYVELLGYNAYWDNIRRALQGGNLNYVYWIGHTNSQIGEERTLITKKITKEGIHRTNFKCWEKKKFILKPSEGRVFSCLQSDRLTSPPTLDLLPQDWETRGHSMWSLRLWETRTIKEFWAIGCETGLEWQNAGTVHSYNDMAYAVGAYYTDSQGNHVHVYFGNREPVWFGGLLDQSLSYPSAIAHIIQSHCNHNLEYALINGPQDNNEREAIWGIDLDRDGWTDNILQWWPLDARLSWINFY